MITYSQPLLLLVAIGFLCGCGQPSEEEIRKTYQAMSFEQLKDEIAKQHNKCRNDPGEADSPPKSCNLSSLGLEVAETKGWCWGPSAATNPDQNWMPCSDDVTRSANYETPWFAVTSSGECRESSMMEAITSVLEHKGGWNIKTAFTIEGFFEASSKVNETTSRRIKLYPSCASALMTYIRPLGTKDSAYVIAPLGIAPRTAGDIYGYGIDNCSTYSFGNGIGCGFGHEEGKPAPIQLSDGFIPCSPNRPVQFDFQLKRGMVGVTCSVTPEIKNTFEEKMANIFGQAPLGKDGTRQWKMGEYVVTSVEIVILGRKLHRVSVYRE